MIFFSKLFVAGVFFISSTGWASAGSPFDDFSGTRVNSDKWSSNPWNTRLEEVREISNGKLVSKVSGKCDESGLVLNQLGFAEPNSINSISTKVTFVEGRFSGNGNNVGPQIEGFYYNDSDGAVWAGMTLEYDGTNYSIVGGVSGNTGFFNAGPFVTQILPNTEYTLKVEYDGTNEFTFSVDGESHQVTGPDRVAESEITWKALTTGIWGMPNDCSGYVSGTFDDVMVDGNPYDNFNTGPLDPANWSGVESVKEIRDHQLQMNVQNPGMQRSTVDLYMAESKTTDFFQADAVITSDTVMSGTNATYGETRVYGSFFNYKYDGTSGYNGEDGEIYGQSKTRRYADGSMEANVSIFSCEDEMCDAYNDIFYKAFSCPVALDTPVTLSVKKTSSSLIFGCDGEEITYTFSYPVYKSNNNYRKLRSRLYSTSGESGYLYTTFDNVYTSENFPWATFLVPILHNASTGN